MQNLVIEPLLTPLTGEEFPKSSNTGNQARADVSARRLWIDGQTAFRDVRILNHWQDAVHSLPAVHKMIENGKKRTYNQQILQVERYLCFHILEE